MHDVHIATDDHDATTRLYAEEVIVTFLEKMREAERHVEELRTVFADYEKASNAGTPEHKETLARWGAQYSLGVAAAGKIARDGQMWLRRLTDHLKPTIAQPIAQPNSQPGLPPKAAEHTPITPLKRPMPAAVRPSGYNGAGVIVRSGGKAMPPPVENVWSRFPVRRVSVR